MVFRWPYHPRMNASRKTYIRTCKQCTGLFETSNSRRGHCSPECYLLFWSTPTNGDCRIWHRKPVIGPAFADWDGKQQLAHRMSYETFKGPIPNKLVILHSCDRGRCINPDHIEAGTQHTNVLDARDRSDRYTLTPEDARLIAASPLSIPALAKQYGVHYTSIWNIRKGIRWGDVTGIKRDA